VTSARSQREQGDAHVEEHMLRNAGGAKLSALLPQSIKNLPCIAQQLRCLGKAYVDKEQKVNVQQNLGDGI
jgi:hypothetical protein